MTHDGPSFHDDEVVFDACCRLRATPGNANDTLEGPAFVGLLGDAHGHDLLDLGCGAAPSRELFADDRTWRRRRSFPLFLLMSARRG